MKIAVASLLSLLFAQTLFSQIIIQELPIKALPFTGTITSLKKADKPGSGHKMWVVSGDTLREYRFPLPQIRTIELLIDGKKASFTDLKVGMVATCFISETTGDLIRLQVFDKKPAPIRLPKK